MKSIDKDDEQSEDSAASNHRDRHCIMEEIKAGAENMASLVRELEKLP